MLERLPYLGTSSCTSQQHLSHCLKSIADVLLHRPADEAQAFGNIALHALARHEPLAHAVIRAVVVERDGAAQPVQRGPVVLRDPSMTIAQAVVQVSHRVAASQACSTAVELGRTCV